LVETFGLPLRYYVDSLRVFRFVQGRDSVWRKYVLQTDDVDTQWGKMMDRLGVDVVYALSPQAKGKIERPYRWLQDRIVRTCPSRRSTTLTMPDRCSLRSGIVTAITRCIPRRRRSPPSDLAAPTPKRTLSSDPSLCRLPTPHRTMSFACKRPGSPTATGAFRSSTMISGWPMCR